MRFSHFLLLGLMSSIMPVAMVAQDRPALSHSSDGTAACDFGKTSEFTLRLSDVIDIKLPFAPDYNETVTVQPDGRIALREAAPVSVLGKTLHEAEAAIDAAYVGILKQPEVSIIPKDFQKPSFFASGEIGKPGRYDIRGNLTLLQAISEAGGMLNERARKKEVVILRPQCDGTYMSTVYNVKKMLAGKGPMEDYVQPGDIIYVPQNRASKIQKYLPTSTIGAYLSPAIV
jgi:polysaccharide biosynthesis/export protein